MKDFTKNNISIMIKATYVTVFWKTDRMVTNTESHFLPVGKCHTHALSRDAMHVLKTIDGHMASDQ